MRFWPRKDAGQYTYQCSVVKDYFPPSLIVPPRGRHDIPAMHRVRFPVLPAFILLYGAMYAAFGVASPFWPLFFESRGLSAEQLGVLLAAGIVPRLLVGLLVGRIADMIGALRAVLALCITLAVAAALGLLSAQGFVLLLAVSLCQTAALTPVTMLADALAINAAARGTGRRAFEYGWARGTGSAAFVLGTLLAGQALALQLMDLSIIVWLHAALLAGAIVGVALVPGIAASRVDAPARTPSVLGGWRELLQNRSFRCVIAVSAIVYGSHAMHDAFAVIRWNAAGISPVTVSILWSEAVAAEVLVFFGLGPFIISRIGPNGGAALAVAAGVARWIVMSLTTEPAVIAMVQPLHGLTFALLHLACMRVFGLAVPARLAATAQAIYGFGAAIMSAILTYVSGILYGQFGAQAFLAMALIAALALPFALAMPDRRALYA
jgi:MFS transporter, PPP family, 3-phenylpropionic acid transporter